MSENLSERNKSGSGERRGRLRERTRQKGDKPASVIWVRKQFEIPKSSRKGR